jgi:hypothetical protein
MASGRSTPSCCTEIRNCTHSNIKNMHRTVSQDRSHLREVGSFHWGRMVCILLLMPTRRKC